MPASYTNREGVQITVDASELTKLNRQLKPLADGKVVRRELNKRIRDAMLVGKEAVQQAARSIPVKNPDAHRIREGVAKGVKVTVTQSGVSLRAAGPLSKQMEGTRPWRHPVYGNRGVWVTQKPHPFFFSTLDPLRPRMVVEVEKVMDDIARKAGFK